MKRWIRLALLVYPAAWRDRYAREFESLVDDIDVRWHDVCDVVSGGLMMRMNQLAAVPLVLGMAGAIVGVAISTTVPTRYKSAAILRFDASDAVMVHEIIQRAVSAKSPDQPALDPRKIAVRLLRDRKVEANTPQTIEVSIFDEDAARAKHQTESLVNRLAGKGKVLMTPDLPTKPSGPNRVAMAGSGSVIGLMLGAAVWVIGRFGRGRRS